MVIPILIPMPVRSGGGSAGVPLPVEDLELLTPEGYEWKVSVNQNYVAIGEKFEYRFFLYKGSYSILGHFSVSTRRKNVRKYVQRRAERYVKKFIRSMEAVYGRDSQD